MVITCGSQLLVMYACYSATWFIYPHKQNCEIPLEVAQNVAFCCFHWGCVKLSLYCVERIFFPHHLLLNNKESNCLVCIPDGCIEFFYKPWKRLCADTWQFVPIVKLKTLLATACCNLTSFLMAASHEQLCFVGFYMHLQVDTFTS